MRRSQVCVGWRHAGLLRRPYRAQQRLRCTAASSNAAHAADAWARGCSSRDARMRPHALKHGRKLTAQVRPGSRTATFCTAVLRIDNARWHGATPRCMHAVHARMGSYGIGSVREVGATQRLSVQPDTVSACNIMTTWLSACDDMWHRPGTWPTHGLARGAGVPFILKAGKALDSSKVEVRLA